MHLLQDPGNTHGLPEQRCADAEPKLGGFSLPLTAAEKALFSTVIMPQAAHPCKGQLLLQS